MIVPHGLSSKNMELRLLKGFQVKRLKLEELRERARLLTREALKDYEIPHDLETKIVLGIGFDGDDRIFELYIPGERPEDAIVITSARLNSFTAEGTVEVFLPKKQPTD